MSRLLKILSENKRIKILNLSNNLLFQESQETPENEELTGELTREEDIECMEHLCSFIKRNKNL